MIVGLILFVCLSISAVSANDDVSTVIDNSIVDSIHTVSSEPTQTNQNIDNSNNKDINQKNTLVDEVSTYSNLNNDDISIYNANDNPTKNIYVSPNGDDSNSGNSAGSAYKTINKTLEGINASDNAIIHFNQGTYVGDGDNSININYAHTVHNGSLTFIGAGYNQTFISGESGYNLFSIEADSNVTFINLTFINAKNQEGGAIYNNGNITLLDCIFENNTATSQGGAIFGDYYSSMTLKNCTFLNNTALSSGGAIYGYNLTISNSQFKQNNATSEYSSGGTIYSNLLNITQSEINGSSARNGGAILLNTGNIENNNFTNCFATSTGGAISTNYGIVYLKNNTMSNCTAKTTGNCIYFQGGSSNIYVTYLGNGTFKTEKGTFNLTATATDDMGNSVSGGNIQFLIDGENVGSAKINNGTATLTITKLLSNGDHIISGNTTLSNAYPADIKTGTLNVNLNSNPIYLWVDGINGHDDTGIGSETNPYKTLAKAINNGFSNSLYPTIYIKSGTYSGENNTNITSKDLGNLTLISVAGYNKVIIDGENVNYGFLFGQYTSCKLINITFINGNSTEYNKYMISNDYNYNLPTEILIQDCLFENNSKLFGLYGANLKNCTFISNSNNNLNYANVNNCTFVNNTNNGDGGAIKGNVLNITNSYFLGNKAVNNTNQACVGGAIYVQNEFFLENCTFINNSANSGGAISAPGNNIEIVINNNTFIHNQANPTVIWDNPAAGAGGAILCGNYKTNITNNKFFNNIAQNGGAIEQNYGDLYLKNNVMGDNFATENGNDIYSKTGTHIGDTNLNFKDTTIDSISSSVVANVTDENGNPISGSEVNFYINGSYIGTSQLINGVAVLEYIGFTNGNYVLSGNYSNTGTFTTNIKNGTVSVVLGEELSTKIVYVSSINGSDKTGNGTLEKPYQTINHAVTTGVSNCRNITIRLLEGIYDGEGNYNISLPGSISFNIVGDGINKTIISGNHNAWVFNINFGKGITQLTNLTITNGTTPSVIAMSTVMNNGTLIVDNCEFTNNFGTRGGAIQNTANLTVTNSYFTYNNQSIPYLNSGTGGAIYNAVNSTAKIYNSIFEGNYARYSGAALSNYGKMTVNNCTFFKHNCTNTDTGRAAGIIFNTNDLTITNSIFKDTAYPNFNATCYDMMLQGRATITNCIFNKSGGLYILNANEGIFINNCTFVNITPVKASSSGSAGVEAAIRAGYNVRLDITNTYFDETCVHTLLIIGQGVRNTNITISDSVILSLIYNQWNGDINFTFLNNWFGSNVQPTILHYKGEYGPENETSPINNWLILNLSADNNPGLSQNIHAFFQSTDGENITTYNGTLTIVKYLFNSTDGIINPNIGYMSSYINTTFTGSTYGNKTVNVTVNNQTINTTFALFTANVTISSDNISVKAGEDKNITINLITGNNMTVSNGTVKVTINGKEYNGTIINNTVLLTITAPEAEGDYTITITYPGSDVFNSAAGSFILTVAKLNVTASLNNATLTPGIENNVTVFVKDEFDNDVTSGNISIVIDNKTYSANVTNGIATVTVPSINTGKYNVTIQYNGDEKYNNLTTTEIIDIAKLNTSINLLTNITTDPITNQTIQVSVVDEKGNPVTSGNVTVILGDKTFTNTVKDGIATIMITTPESGNYTMNINYADIYKYNNSTKNIDLVFKINKDMISVFNMITGVSSGENFTATLYDGKGNPLSGREMSFTLVNALGQNKTYWATTNTEGVAKLQINLAYPSDYKLIINYKENNTEISPDTITANITIIKGVTSNNTVLITPDMITNALSGENYTVTLKNKDGKVLAGQEISIILTNSLNQNKTYWTTTNTEGVAKLPINLAYPTTYTLTSYFEGKDNITSVGPSIAQLIITPTT